MLNKKLIIIKEIINKKMEKLKVNEIKEIFRFMGIRGYSALKKPQLLERMRNESIYDRYLNKKKEENQEKEKTKKLKDEKIANLQEFWYKIDDDYEDLYNEDESDTEDSVCEDEFEDFKNEYLVYGDYPEIEDELNTKNTAQEKKEYLLSEDFGDEDINDYEYKFGNSLQFSQNRAHSHYIIGKNDELIIPDMFGDGDLVIPYEITKFNKNATRAFDMKMVGSIYLRYDDAFVKKYIRGRIYKKWNWKILYNNMENIFQIEFPNGRTQEFKKNTHVMDILSFLHKSDSITSKININVEYNNEIKIFDYLPLVPSTWTSNHGSSGGGADGGFMNITYTGPEDEKDPMKDLIKKSFDNKEGITYRIS